MLILSRFINQEVCIGDDITVTIVSIAGGKVRLGINAPTGLPVHRREIYDRIKSGISKEKPRVPKGKNQRRMRRFLT